jgi:hypothetical protein
MKTQASLAAATAILLGLCATAGHAATIVCAGTVETLSFHATSTGGLLMIRLSSMNLPVYFCDPDNPFAAPGSGYSVSAATCKALYATFLAAKVSGQPIANMYFDGDAAPASCNAWGSWQYMNVRHYLF